MHAPWVLTEKGKEDKGWNNGFQLNWQKTNLLQTTTYYKIQNKYTIKQSSKNFSHLLPISNKYRTFASMLRCIRTSNIIVKRNRLWITTSSAIELYNIHHWVSYAVIRATSHRCMGLVVSLEAYDEVALFFISQI